MPSSHLSIRPDCPHRRTRLSLFALLAVAHFVPAAAMEPATGWQLEPGFDLRMVTYYQSMAGASMTRAALGAHLGLELSSLENPLATGVFADYELAARDVQPHVRLLGGWARYRNGLWELSTSVAHYTAANTSGRWMYANKLQFKPRSAHSIALEAIGAINDGGAPTLQLVYDTDLTDRVSLCVSIGLGSNRLLDVGASTQLVWSIR